MDDKKKERYRKLFLTRIHELENERLKYAKNKEKLSNIEKEIYSLRKEIEMLDSKEVDNKENKNNKKGRKK